MQTVSDLIDNNDLSALQKLIEENPSLVNNLNDRGEPKNDQPLHTAARENRAEIAEMLINHGAIIDARDDDGRTALHLAADSSPETVAVLLKHRASTDTIDKWGYSPFAWAVLSQQREGEQVVQLLRAAGAKYGLLEATAMGDLAGVQAAFADDPEALKRITSHETLLSLASTVFKFGGQNDRLEIIDLLFEKGLKMPKKAIQKHLKSAEVAGREDLSRTLRRHISQG